SSGVCVIVFFFSSRRRHTRFSRDWSSDVCSSDLPWHFDASGLSTDGSTRSWNVLDTELAPGGNCLSIGKGTRSGNGHFPTGSGRSEERRVGKECRSRWAQGE